MAPFTYDSRAPEDPFQQRMLHMYENASLFHSDVTFKVGGRLFQAHKCIVSAASEPLRAMLEGGNSSGGYKLASSQKGGFMESTQREVEIGGMSAAAFESILRYMYTGSLCFASWHDAVDVLLAANMYLLDHAATMCTQYLVEHMLPHNVFVLLEVADYICDETLLKAAQAYITEHAHTLCALMASGDMPGRHVTILIGWPEIHVDEDTLMNSLSSWLNIKEEKRLAKMAKKDGEARKRSWEELKCWLDQGSNKSSCSRNLQTGPKIPCFAQWDKQVSNHPSLTFNQSGDTVRATESNGLTRWVGAVGKPTRMFPSTKIEFTVNEVGVLGGIGFGVIAGEHDEPIRWRDDGWMLCYWRIAGAPTLCHGDEPVWQGSRESSPLREGDTISLIVDQSDGPTLTFLHNGCLVTKIRANLPANGRLRFATMFCRPGVVSVASVRKTVGGGR